MYNIEPLLLQNMFWMILHSSGMSFHILGWFSTAPAWVSPLPPHEAPRRKAVVMKLWASKFSFLAVPPYAWHLPPPPSTTVRVRACRYSSWLVCPGVPAVFHKDAVAGSQPPPTHLFKKHYFQKSLQCAITVAKSRQLHGLVHPNKLGRWSKRLVRKIYPWRHRGFCKSLTLYSKPTIPHCLHTRYRPHQYTTAGVVEVWRWKDYIVLYGKLAWAVLWKVMISTYVHD